MLNSEILDTDKNRVEHVSIGTIINKRKRTHPRPPKTMTPSALALALLASRISASAGRGVGGDVGGGGEGGRAATATVGGGGGGAVPRYEKIALLRGADPASAASAPSSSSKGTAVAAASSSSDDDMAVQARCQTLPESECDLAPDCSWCVSGAVPSACYASSLSGRLPERTFVCAKAETASSASSVGEGREKKTKVVEVFDFAGTTLTLSSAEVDKTFCDASSPISLAGYMNGEFFF